MRRLLVITSVVLTLWVGSFFYINVAYMPLGRYLIVLYHSQVKQTKKMDLSQKEAEIHEMRNQL